MALALANHIRRLHVALTLLVLQLPGDVADDKCDTRLTDAYYSTALSSLLRQGYTLSRGVMQVTDQNGFGANPGNPYVLYQGLPQSNDDGSFAIGEQDAVLLIACTPPEVRYFSWRSYLFRGGGDGLVFASMGDPTNSLVINTLNKRQTVHEQATAIVTTGDATTYEDVAAALQTAGLGDATNLDQVELSLFNGSSAEYVMLHRASIWSSEAARDAYFAKNSTIYLVRPPAERPSKPLPLSAMRPRGSGSKEKDIPGLLDSLGALRQAVLSSMSAVGGVLNDTFRCDDTSLVGRDCIANDINCLGDNPDANYITCASPLPPHPESHSSGLHDVFVFLGTNCRATGKCTYHNAGVYYEAMKSTVLTTDDRSWNGSALAFAPTLDPSLASQLVAMVFARNCSGFDPFCIKITYEQVPQGETWYPVSRTYLDPTSATGPLIDELIMPSVLHFVLPGTDPPLG